MHEARVHVFNLFLCDLPLAALLARGGVAACGSLELRKDLLHWHELRLGVLAASRLVRRRLRHPLGERFHFYLVFLTEARLDPVAQSEDRSEAFLATHGLCLVGGLSNNEVLFAKDCLLPLAKREGQVVGQRVDLCKVLHLLRHRHRRLRE